MSRPCAGIHYRRGAEPSKALRRPDVQYAPRRGFLTAVPHSRGFTAAPVLYWPIEDGANVETPPQIFSKSGYRQIGIQEFGIYFFGGVRAPKPESDLSIGPFMLSGLPTKLPVALGFAKYEDCAVLSIDHGGVEGYAAVDDSHPSDDDERFQSRRGNHTAGTHEYQRIRGGAWTEIGYLIAQRKTAVPDILWFLDDQRLQFVITSLQTGPAPDRHFKD